VEAKAAGMTKQTEERISEAWRDHRTHLVDLAFGMLGDIGSAEDAVQEAFVRLAKTDPAGIEDLRGWLTVVVSRICLDRIRSAQARRERAYDVSTIERAGPPSVQALPVDPADRVTLDDEVSLALMVVLQRLKPAERVVFVLHDVFQMPFDTIAETVGRPAATCRQLARRARLKITAETAWSGGGGAGLIEQRLVTERFMQACSRGDLQALLEVLDPEVWGDVDLGEFHPRTGTVAHGRDQVAGNLMLYYHGSKSTLVWNPVGGRAAVLAFIDSELWAVILLTIADEVVKSLHAIADPRKIRVLRGQLPDHDAPLPGR
jgi:RNA polymerase sigma-70 factor (ECF subfamily)